MAKITLDPIVGSYASVTALNSRFQQIEDEFNSDVLYRNNPTGETNTMSNDLDMNGYSILNTSDFAADELYLGKSATAPTTSKTGDTLGASHAGVIYFNTTSNDMWVWNGTAWGLIGTTQNSAASVTIADVGGHYAATNVEAALQELGSTATGEGASIIGLEDAGNYFPTDNVEAALTYLATRKDNPENPIINGDMRIWQRGTSFAGLTPAGSLTILADRWRYLAGTTTGVITVASDTDAPTVAQSGVNLPASMKVSVTTADASLDAADVVTIRHNMEGKYLQPLWGADATLSFWVKSPKTGTYTVSLSNSANNRFYLGSYTIDVANTWEKKTITVPLTDGGTWLFDENVGIRIDFTLMCGSAYQGASGSWGGTTVWGVATQANLLDNVANTFNLAQVKLEPGTTATQFIVKDWGDELRRCQRYYAKTCEYDIAPETIGAFEGCFNVYAPTTASGATPWRWEFPVPMRTAPGVSTWSVTTGTPGTVRDITGGADVSSAVNYISEKSLMWGLSGSMTAHQRYIAQLEASAEL